MVSDSRSLAANRLMVAPFPEAGPLQELFQILIRKYN
jgi:hypothetical protein